MRRYTGYLFDLDGTLVDTAPDINVALNHALASRGHPPVDEALTRHWVGHGARALVTQAMERSELPEAEAEDLIESFIAHYGAHIAVESRPYPGVVEVLGRLRAEGARLAVVTNKRTQLTEPLLAALGLDEYLAAIVCGDTTERPKPAPDPALHACRLLDIAVGEALFVGDSETDVKCARAAGCPVVVVRDGYNHGIPAHALLADAVIESFHDLV
ncbi:MAG: phosphoglycolate phosphatase [Gammaproteobacteria bacterium]|jgi:phosphoglycolate phosphatase